MAESVLREIVEHVVQNTYDMTEEKQVVDRDVNLEIKKNSENPDTDSCGDNFNKIPEEKTEDLKEKIQKQKKKAEDLREKDKIRDENEEEFFPAEFSDDVTECNTDYGLDDDDDDAASENSILTTEDEAEDFLRHVLSNGSDDDSKKKEDLERNGFPVSGDINNNDIKEFSGKCENRSPFAKFDARVIKSADNLPKMLDTEKKVKKNLELLALHEQKSSEHLCNASAATHSVDEESSEIDKNASVQGTLPVAVSGSAGNKNTFVDDNNNNNACASCNTLGDTNLLKSDWSCLSNTQARNRDTCTSDAEVDSISPELCCMMQLSPDTIYGKEHTLGFQRLYSRQVLRSDTPASTLNTPDLIFFEDTDSNESDMPALRKFGESESENPLPSWSKMDVNNNIYTDDIPKGNKRKLADVDDQESVAPDIRSSDVVTSLMNQGRPPDISTWRAVSPTDSKSSCFNEDVTGQWNKPTCTVQPFQNTGHLRDTLSNGLFGTARIYNPNELPSSQSMTQQTHSQYNDSAEMSRQPCQFTANHIRNSANYTGVNSSFQNSAVHRIDFSSPVNMCTPGLLNFVSHPSYHGVNLMRPRAVYANNIQQMSLNTAYDCPQRYPSVPYRSFNTAQFNNFNLSSNQDFDPSPFQNPCNTFVNNTPKTTLNPPSATQTFAESQTENNFNETRLENTPHQIDSFKIEENTNKEDMSDSEESNKDRMDASPESNEPESDQTNSGCEECDITLNDVDTEGPDNTHDTKVGTDTDRTTQYTLNIDEAEDKSVRSLEADSTTIDLTTDTAEENMNNDDHSDEVDLQAPAQAHPQAKNRYYTEIYRPKCKPNSLPTSAKALDLSKKSSETDSKRLRSALQPKIRPYGEPGIPLSAVLNSVPAPTLAYSGAMLVPYMNSIFAALTHNKKQSLPTVGNTALPKTTESTLNVSSLTPASSQNQQLVMCPNYLSAAGMSASSENVNNSTNSTVDFEADKEPAVNMNSIPLPLYAAPLQYPVRPLVSVVNPVNNLGGLQRIVNPYLYRFNLGMPMNTATNSAFGTPHNNGTVGTNGSSSLSGCSSSTVGSKENKTAAKTKKTGPKTLHRKNSAVYSEGLSKQKQNSETSSVNNNILPSFQRSISAVDGLSLSIQGSNLTATEATQSRGLMTYQPVPDDRLYRTSTETKKKTFKAKHFPFSFLQIGSFEYSCGSNCSDKMARVKFLFSKRAMVYEFQLDRPEGTSGICKDMVEIEVPFSTIVSLWLYDRDMRLEVKVAPKSFLGKRRPEKNTTSKIYSSTVYNRKLQRDITDGQLTTAVYHYVQFRKCCAARLKSELREFDTRFEVMLRLPLIEDSSKSLKPETRQPTSQLLDPSICLPDIDSVNNNFVSVSQPECSQELSLIVSCACTSGCSAASCQCCVKGTTCTEGICVCVNCRNPLNILHQLGLPADRARTDPCLMENIYQIKRLDYYVKTQLILECCHIPVLLFSCIPGEVRCVGHNCSARYKYSWCTARLLNEDSTPRNHCVKCGMCTDYRNLHCHRCNICYFAGENHTRKCPICDSNGKEKPSNSPRDCQA